MLTDVGLISHLIAAAGFGAFAGVLLLRRQFSGARLWLVLAAITTMAWAIVFVLAVRAGGIYLALLSPFETLRTAAWVAFLIALLRVSWRLDERLSSSFVTAAAMGFIIALQLVIDGAVIIGAVPETGMAVVATLFAVSRMAVAISGLVLIHNLYLNTETADREGIRLLAIGMAGFFVYDLNLYTLQFLFGKLSPDLYNIRGAVDTIVIPLLLLSSSRDWVSRIQVSRQVAFHSLSFTMIGIYLIAMALVSYGLRLVGGDLGRLLQISFLFSTIIIAAVVLVSPQFRAKLRVLIAKNFFTYKYDYRQEWLRFIDTVSSSRSGSEDLPERVIQAVCAVVDSPGGVLFAPDDEGDFEVAARWKFADFSEKRIVAQDDLAVFLASRQRIVDFDELRAGRGEYGAMRLPEWAALDRRAWLVLPLIHINILVGILLVQRTVAERELNWEDYDLLRTLGRQAASYIAEASSQAALDEAGKFDEFNRRFAFIMHDIKNLVSQLSLVARNAERHADKPEFRADMAATLKSSVGKMNDMLARLAQHNTARSEPAQLVDLHDLARTIVEARRLSYPALALVGHPDPQPVYGELAKLEQVLTHLIQNAIDASSDGDVSGGASGDKTSQPPIYVGVQRVGKESVVTITDHGKGMTPAFVRSELFKPFHSTKAGGFGIGAYESRAIIHALNGRLDVSSREGEGTVFTIRLPAADLEGVMQRETAPQEHGAPAHGGHAHG